MLSLLVSRCWQTVSSYYIGKPTQTLQSEVEWIKAQMPAFFQLPDLVALSANVFELKAAPNQYRAEVDKAARAWFASFDVYENDKARSKFLDAGRFDLFTVLTFPHADNAHLETCLAVNLWAFSTDDFSDEGDFQSDPEKVQASVNRSLTFLHDEEAECPEWPYAAMLHSLLRKIRATATPGAYRRFKTAFEAWSAAQVLQAANRKIDRMPSSEEFILMRRKVIGAPLVEAMVEYSLDLDVPDNVFEDPIIRAMSDATTDIMTWPNDLISFNKEQADGDYQNLVFVLMVEHRIDLQSAIDLLVSMLQRRIDDYIVLKAQLPSFGSAAVDSEVSKYIKNLEHFVQGTILWYYLSPRYFRDIDVSDRANLTIPVFPSSF